MTTSSWPYSTASPLAGRIALTVPSTGATTWFMSFMTSTMARVSPAETTPPTSTNGGAAGEGARQKRPTDGDSTTIPLGTGGVTTGGSCVSPPTRSTGSEADDPGACDGGETLDGGGADA